MLQTELPTEIRKVASSGSLQLAIVREGPGGLGAIIDSAASRRRIEGVEIAPLTLRPDDRGWFEELFRQGQGLASAMAANGTLQVSAALAYPGTVKAIHY